MQGHRSAVRRAWALLAAGYLAGSAVLGSLAVTLAGPLAQEAAARQPGSLDRALGAGAALLAWALLSWLAAATAAELVRLTRLTRLTRLGQPTRPDRTPGPARSPRLANRLAALLLGVSLAATAASGQALALDRPAPPVPATSTLPGWTPDRPAAPPRPAPQVRLVTSAPRVEHALGEDVVVRRGDSLWDIAARHLGPTASAEAVAAEWPRWYAANRDVIGPDPDLIHPGQRLRPPGQ